MQQKKASVLGDSVSTYEGCNPQGYSVFYHAFEIEQNGLTGWQDMWWARVMNWLNAQPLVIDAYSGSRAAGAGFPAASCDTRLMNLGRNGETPDIILVYIGTNDFGYGVPLRRRHRFGPKDLTVFADAYAHLLTQLRLLYPKAWVMCGTLMRTRLRGEPEWKMPERMAGDTLDTFNEVIRECCRKTSCVLVDLAQTGMLYETLDGAHPTADGHKTFADAWISCLLQQDVPRAMMRRDLQEMTL